jgi:hypothetical protein
LRARSSPLRPVAAKASLSVAGCRTVSANAAWDEEAGGPLHTGTVEKKLFGFCGSKVSVVSSRWCRWISSRRDWSQIDFGKDAGLELDISKKILCLYNKFEVKAGGGSDSVKAEIFTPSLMQMITQCIFPCGSQILFRIRQAGEDSDTWHVRTPQVCCTMCGVPCSCTGCTICEKTLKFTFPISAPEKFEEEGSITIEADFCCGGLCGAGGILTSRSRIFVDFPSGSRSCSADCKHALMCVAMMLDASRLGAMSWCA